VGMKVVSTSLPRCSRFRRYCIDEPTVGSGPPEPQRILDNLETLKKRGKDLLYTTHYRKREASLRPDYHY